jgi:hypothetical protein
MPIKTAQAQVEHAGLSTTAKIYTYVRSPEQYSSAAVAVGRRTKKNIFGTLKLLNTWSNLSVSVPEFWALIGHLTRVRLQKNGKTRTIFIAGWSSLVARRAHNPEVAGSNPAPATSNPK